MHLFPDAERWSRAGWQVGEDGEETLKPPEIQQDDECEEACYYHSSRYCDLLQNFLQP